MPKSPDAKNVDANLLICTFHSSPLTSWQYATKTLTNFDALHKIKILPRALVGIHENDTEKDLEYCAKKLLGSKLWSNDSGPWRHGAKTKGLEILCVSQFTLYGKLTKKNQPDYKASMKAIPAKAMYENFLEMLKSQYEPEKIKDGVFGAMMDVGKWMLPQRTRQSSRVDEFKR